ncbi:YaaA family protein [Actinokineospora fastidiosa]|uniref:Peroxide stress protein YaaA n=1 Tax=Actinokineospora fastidiosa TaxID=1816 RepID=A0A918GIL9_9PSEU|nr:peroxide stress protein YaaA [Actinokineospora fastidiosa]GGS39259.1 peroxide stress protein YaaA [Actinokineospora fastidiosa]
MLVLLPPSETKADGGSGAPLDLAALSFPELNPVRDRLATALAGLDPAPAMAALGLSERQADEVERNARLRETPTMPAIERYTGVLYDALGYGSFTRAQRARAGRRLAVASALFGVVRADDPIPAYRLSGGTVLPGVGGLRGVWRADLEKTLSAADELVIDLRSGPYAALAAIPHAITVKVVTASGAAVSHFNKAHKGRLAAALACAPREPGTVRGVVSIAAAAGLRLVQAGRTALELVVG